MSAHEAAKNAGRFVIARCLHGSFGRFEKTQDGIPFCRHLLRLGLACQLLLIGTKNDLALIPRRAL